MPLLTLRLAERLVEGTINTSDLFVEGVPSAGTGAARCLCRPDNVQ